MVAAGRLLGRFAWAIGRNPSELKRLGKEGAPAARALARALAASAAGTLGPAEAVWADRIESLRRALSSSSRVLSLEDWGAVAPGKSAGGGSGPLIVKRRVSEICRVSSSRPRRARLLFRLARELQPRVCLELGTSLGLSSAYLAAALEMNGEGGLTTLEGAGEVAGLARENLSRLGLERRATVAVGRFQDRLPGLLEESGPIDFAFIDGHHAEGPTLEYFEVLLPRLASSACLVFDDISWSEGMRRAWGRIAADPRIGIAVDLFTMGIVLMVPASSPRCYRIAAV